MKNSILLIVFLVSFNSLKVSAQVNTNQVTQNNVADSNAFLDASTNFNTSASSSASMGKGLVFPDTNLTTYKFDITAADGITFPSYFDGMLVYNTGTGSTADPLLTTQTTGLVRGWYYFSNPNGEVNGNITSGRWLPVGAAPVSPVINITATEKVTNTQINGAPIYTKKGKFTASGASTAPTAYTPAATTTGMTGLYRITIFKAGTGTVYSNSVYSYDIANGNLITGSPLMSVVYPAGDYDYVIEYTK